MQQIIGSLFIKTRFYDFGLWLYAAFHDNGDSATVANLPSDIYVWHCRRQEQPMVECRKCTAVYIVPAFRIEAHFFQNGIHGTGFAVGDPVLGQWTNLMYNWMTAGGFLTRKQQVALAGIVKLDGSPLLKGIVILTPVE